MKMSARQILMVSFISTALLGTAWAGEASTVGVTLDAAGKYIWRGQALTDDPVFQPGVSIGVGGFTASIWGNMDLTDHKQGPGTPSEKGQFTEIDYALDYSGEAYGFGYSLGLIYYDFPHLTNDAGTTEIYGGLSKDMFLNPSITLYYDIDDINGAYISGGIGHTIEEIFSLGEGLPVNLDLSASLGWGSSGYTSSYWGAPATSSALNDLVLSAALPFDLGNGLSVTPFLTWVTLVDSDIRSTNAYDSDSDYLFGGISLAAEF